MPLDARGRPADARGVFRCLIATGNPHKLEEFRALLGAGVRVVSAREIPGGPAPAETGQTFEANARLKALAWAVHLAAGAGDPVVEWVLADDSGLEVDALDGAPGVHSARFAAADGVHPRNAPDAENNSKLLRLLAGVPDAQRGAQFRCVLALTPVLRGLASGELDARTRCFEGICRGRIAREASGKYGFGYDPLFIPDGLDRSFAALGDALKSRISHRARASEALRAGGFPGTT